MISGDWDLTPEAMVAEIKYLSLKSEAKDAKSEEVIQVKQIEDDW